MKTPKTLAYGFTILLLITAVVVFAPSSVAQGEESASIATTNPPKADTGVLRGDSRLPPESVQYNIQFAFTVTLPPVKGAVCPTGTVTVEFKVAKKPDYATVTLAPGLVTKNAQAASPSQNVVISGFDTIMTIVTTRKAPAFQTGEYQLSAQAKPSGTTAAGCVVKDSNVLIMPVTLVNDYFPIMEYQPARYIQKTGQNKDIVFSIKMTNFGNGDTKVSSTVTPVSKNKLDAVIPPSQTTLESKSVSGEKALFTKDAVVTGRTPHANGYTNSIYTFSVAFSATSVQTGKDIAVDDQTLTLSVQVQGVYVPGFDPTMAIAGLGIALIGLGLRRRE